MVRNYLVFRIISAVCLPVPGTVKKNRGNQPYDYQENGCVEDHESIVDKRFNHRIRLKQGVENMFSEKKL